MNSFFPQIDSLIKKVNDDSAPLLDHIIKLLDFTNKDKTKSCDQIEAGLKKAFGKPESANWISSKINSLISETDEKNLTAVLSEIRAFGILIDIFQDTLNPQTGKGSDFSIGIGKESVLIDVYTPQIKANVAGLKFINRNRQIISTIQEYFPLGKPKRLGKDNIQGEAVSRLASIKEGETQFNEKSINVLWIDIINYQFKGMDILEDQYIPYISFQSHITFGAFWHAFYAKKGDKIYDQLETEYMSDEPYIMEFNGRFQRRTKLNFVFINSNRGMIVFENHKRKCKIKNFYKKIFELLDFKIEYSYLNWPVPNLSKVIKISRNKGRELIKIFTGK